MGAAFLDTQDESNAMNGAVLRNGQSVADLLTRLRDREPFFFMLEGRGGLEMLVGLGAHAGCAQFTDKSGTARIAVSPEPAQRAMEFLSGDTPTPVDGRNLLPLPMLQHVVTEFVEHARQSQNVAWELV